MGAMKSTLLVTDRRGPTWSSLSPPPVLPNNIPLSPPLFPLFLQFAPATLVTIQFSITPRFSHIGAFALVVFPSAWNALFSVFHGGISLSWWEASILSYTFQLSCQLLRALLCCPNSRTFSPFLVLVTLQAIILSSQSLPLPEIFLLSCKGG